MPADYPDVAILLENEIVACLLGITLLPLFASFNETWHNPPTSACHGISFALITCCRERLSSSIVFSRPKNRTLTQGRKTLMKIATGIFSGLALTSVLALGAVANSTATNKTAQTAKPGKTAAAPKNDSEIQSCISSKLTTAPKIKDQGFSVSVSGGTATFTGTTKNAGSKGGVGSIAKSCGAKQVVNHISVESTSKAAGSAASPKHVAKPKK
jgi:BON domain